MIIAILLGQRARENSDRVAFSMPNHPCIFCQKRSVRPFPNTSSHSADAGGSINHPVAVPVFMGRVSPVLDTCTRLCLVDVKQKTDQSPKSIPLKSATIFDRTAELKTLGVRTIICGAVSDAFYNLLREAGMDLVCGITGDVNEVIEAYSSGTLEQPRFRMPGSE